jgi:hypothetical protein
VTSGWNSTSERFCLLTLQPLRLCFFLENSVLFYISWLKHEVKDPTILEDDVHAARCNAASIGKALNAL